MKNIVFFVVLAILTVAALVGWNALRNNPVNETAQNAVPTITPTPTMEVGTAVGRVGLGALTQNTSTASADRETTKGGTSISETTPSIRILTTPVPTKTIVVSATTPPPSNPNLIAFTDTGFTPKSLTVKSGTMVRFVNQSSKRMWIVSAEVAGGKKLQDMNMGLSVGKDGIYEYQFNQTGTWGFFDQNYQQITGTVLVN